MSILARPVVGFVVMSALFACSGDPVHEASAVDHLVNPTATTFTALNSRDEHGRRHVAILDDCDPNDPAWNATGGCVLRGGVVTEAEFGMLLTSPRSLSTVGHPAWRMEPSYLRVASGSAVSVTNDGGRNHTFTAVAQFGGGFVGLLNIGLTQAPECSPVSPTINTVAPGGRLQLTGLAPGNHRFQCCIHPWMRALIKVS